MTLRVTDVIIPIYEVLLSTLKVSLCSFPRGVMHWAVGCNCVMLVSYSHILWLTLTLLQ